MRLILLSILSALLLQPLAADDKPTETKVYSEVDDNAVPSLVNLTSLPSALVNGCVNVITGDLCEYDQDDIVTGGPDPYILGHSYCSSSLEEGNLGDGWNFLHHHFLEVFQPGRIKYVRKGPDDDIPFLYPIEITPEYRHICDPDNPLLAQMFEQPFSLEEGFAQDDDFENCSESIHGDSLLSRSGSSDNTNTECSSNHKASAPSNHPMDWLHGLLRRVGIEKGIEREHKDARARRGPNSQNKGNGRSTHDPIFLSIYDPSGGRLLFKTNYDEDHKERSLRHFELVTKNSGFTNISGGQMSGQTNVKNIRVKWDKKEDRFHVTLGDGTERVYERQWKKKDMDHADHEEHEHANFYRDYQLHKETKPNGNIVVYDYNDKHEITEIRTYNKDLSHKLSWVKFEQRSTGDFAKHPSLHVKTSDGFEHVYYFKRLNGSHMHGTYSVSNISRQGLPQVHFEYKDKKNSRKARVESKKCDDGFYIFTEYYNTKKKFLKNRVRKQSSPVGPNGTEVATHKYAYYKDAHGAGHCSVRDAYNNLTRYYWNKDKRLVRIVKFDSCKHLLMKEKFIWGENGTYNEGNLRARILIDEENKTRLVRKFNYDGRGNLLEDILLARITENAGDINFKKDLTHNEECDKAVTSYTYSDDGFNLKTSECDPLGNYTYYGYVTGTNLLKSKFICGGKHVRKREFFSYDSSGILTAHIIDDGHTKDKYNLEQATERHITKITPRTNRPHFGEPEEIEEFYYDFKDKKEVFLKKTVNHFNSRGLVVRQELVDQMGNIDSYEYGYDDIGRLTYIKNPLGHTEEFTYNQKTARLVEKKGVRDDVRWHNTYDGCGRLIQETEKHTNALTLTTEHEYDHLNRKISTKDPQGNTTYYTYDALDRIISITYPKIYDHSGNKHAPQKKFTYKNLGSVVIEEDELGLLTKTTYNALGKITDQELPDGTTHHFYYDLKGNVKKEVSPNGAVNHIYYDAFDRPKVSRLCMHGELLARNEVVYNNFHPIQEIGPTGETVTYSYDFAGRKIAQTQNDRKTTCNYDSKSRLSHEYTHLEQDEFICKRYKYDNLNRITYETLRDHKKYLRTEKHYGYDNEGNPTYCKQNIDGQDAISKSRFHPHGLPEEHTDPEGNKTLHKYYYDHINKHGQTVLRTETIDARGVTQEQIFDARGNLSQVSHYDPMHSLIARKELFYDAASNCTRTQESAISEVQINTIITCFEYTKGHLSKITEAYDTPEEKSTRYIYDLHGQLETIIHADGTILNHRYDAKGRLEKFYSSDYTIDYTYSYDASDRILEVKNNATGKKTTRSYNAFGEVISETLETGLTLTYAYDKAGRVKELTLPDGSQVAYSYSAYLETVQRLDCNGQELYKHQILERDLSGYTKATQLPGTAGPLIFKRDKLGRNTNILHAQFEEKVPMNGFDPVGNLLKLSTKDPQGAIERAFSYDFLSQLTQETGPTTHSYSYDSLYNRLSQDDASYDVNSLHSVLSDSKRTFTYDPRGNRLLMRSLNDDVHYTYDALDRLIEVRTKNLTYKYTYDPFNRRLTKECTTTSGPIEPSKEAYLYALDNEIGALDNSGTLTELRILGEGYGAEIGASIALELHGTTYIPIHDRQGSITMLLDLKGKPVESYRYDAFGNETIGSISTPTHNPWRFSSKRTDPETGLVYFGRRYYDPSLGKWLTQDPLGLKAGPNLYAYVQNGPMTRFDLYGLLSELETGQCERVYSGNGNHAVLEHSYVEFGYERDASSDRRDESKRKGIVKSEFIPAGSKEIPGVYIISTNGIFNTKTTAQDNLNYLSSLGEDVTLQGLWNATNGPFDLIEAGLQTKFGFYSPPSRMLRDKLIELNNKDPDAVFFVPSFSQGAAVVKGALELSKPNIRQKVISVALGPAAIIPSALCLKSFNYISRGDLVTWIADHSGIALNRDCVYFLDRHPNALPFPLDHSFQSPTYRERLEYHVNRYIKTYGKKGNL